jgi:hypothetical protein
MARIVATKTALSNHINDIAGRAREVILVQPIHGLLRDMAVFAAAN